MKLITGLNREEDQLLLISVFNKTGIAIQTHVPPKNNVYSKIKLDNTLQN